MLSKIVTPYIPALSLVFILLALIFEIMSATNYNSTEPTSVTNISKYHNLALILAVIGGFLLVVSK